MKECDNKWTQKFLVKKMQYINLRLNHESVYMSVLLHVITKGHLMYISNETKSFFHAYSFTYIFNTYSF